MTQQRLFIKDIVSVGVVDEGDNPTADIVLMKRRNTTNINENTPDRDRETRKGKPMADMPNLDTLDTELRDEIEKALAAKDARIAELEAATDTPEDVMKGLSDEAKARFVELEKKAADTEAALAKERDARLTAEAIEKARPYEALIGKATEAVEYFKDPATADWLVSKLEPLKAQLEASNLFKEFGAGDDDVSAVDQIETLAKETIKDNPELSMVQAKVLVRKAHPELKQREREEREGR